MRRSLRRAFLLGLAVGAVTAWVRRARPGSPPPQPATQGPTPDPPADRGEEAPAWAEAVDGGCPDGYPVKAKESSGIFHVPGGLSYERTNPDRCYRRPEDAEADGFRPAKR